jgi:MbtH protein
MIGARVCIAVPPRNDAHMQDLSAAQEGCMLSRSDRMGIQNLDQFKSQITDSGETWRMPVQDQSQDQSSEEMYLVVVNHEEQYSIWRDDKSVPAGWRAVGKRGPKAECLQYIEDVWTDMRPLSLRKRMADAAGRGAS